MICKITGRKCDATGCDNGCVLGECFRKPAIKITEFKLIDKENSLYKKIDKISSYYELKPIIITES